MACVPFVTATLLDVTPWAAPSYARSTLVLNPPPGEAFFDMERAELDTKYTRVTAELAEEEWDAAYAASLSSCMHGTHCVQGPGCQVGRRQIEGEAPRNPQARA